MTHRSDMGYSNTCFLLQIIRMSGEQNWNGIFTSADVSLLISTFNFKIILVRVDLVQFTIYTRCSVSIFHLSMAAVAMMAIALVFTHATFTQCM